MTEETRPVTILDREIQVKAFKDAQIMLMISEAKTVTRNGTDTSRRLDGADRMMRLLDSVVVDPDDKEWLIEQNVAGNLTMGNLIGFISAFKDEDPTQVAPRAVRRGRPPKR